MLATYVIPQQTVLTWEQASTALRWAMTDTSEPTLDQLALGCAKSALETGRWQKMWNFNWGNLKSGETYVGMYTCFRCNEVLDGKVRWFDPAGELDGNMHLTGKTFAVPPGHPQTRFRAFANEWDGAQSYIEVLQQRFPAAWKALLTGSPEQYVHALKASRYFTADEAPYLKGVRSLFNEFRARIQGLSHEAADLDAGLLARVELEHALWFDRQLHPSEDPNA
jgi:phage gp37-like protein